MHKRIIEVGAGLVAGALCVSCGASETEPPPSNEGEPSILQAEQAFRAGKSRSSVIKDAHGNKLAYVVFTKLSKTQTQVTVGARLPAVHNGIHGFHVHANDNPANGEGCIADPAQPASTHFVSADGHYNPEGQIHGAHAGDMPALFVGSDGVGAMAFLTDHFETADVKGRAVIIHELPDNYANVPVGSAPNQYTPNSPDATTLTNNTGNAGNRIGCGIIR